MAGFHVSWTEILKFFELPTLVFFLNNVEIIVNKICFWKEKCPRSLNPSKAIAMAICPIIVHFGTWRARSMHDVACEFARSKDAQKQLARTSLNLQLLKLRLQPRWSHLNFICISTVQSTSIHSSFSYIIFIFSNSTSSETTWTESSQKTWTWSAATDSRGCGSTQAQFASSPNTK